MTKELYDDLRIAQPSGECWNCGCPLSEHCAAHLIPCCPGKCPLSARALHLVGGGEGANG